MTPEQQLDRVFSLYIRLKYADFRGYAPCFTCDERLPWQELQAGHFIRRQHSSVRFHEDNVRPQCRSCNEFRDGMEHSFEERLRDELGDEEVDDLIELGRREEQYTEAWYRERTRYYRGQVAKFGVKI